MKLSNSSSPRLSIVLALGAVLSLETLFACDDDDGFTKTDGTSANDASVDSGSTAAPADAAPDASDTVADAGSGAQFHASWTAAMQDATEVSPPPFPAPPAAEVFDNQTVRHVLRLSSGGDSLRLRVSNLFGKTPVTFSGVHVAKSTGASNIDPTTDHAVSFGGQATITVAAGAEATSDPVAMATTSLSNIAVTMFFASSTTMPTVHSLGQQTAYIGAGDQLAAAAVPAATADQRTSYYGLTSVETSSADKTNVVVTFGDSITDGYASTVDATKRYPDALVDRLNAAGYAHTAVANEGISGNRWITDAIGPNGNGRFARDVLAVPGITHAVILLGINDIGFGQLAPAQTVTADQITTSIGTAIASAKSKGIKVFVATLLPYKGSLYYSADVGEPKRQAVNTFVRTNTRIDGVIDFDATMRDATDPLTLNAAYDSGDHLHPNDIGYGAMAVAIDLAKLQ